MKTYQFKLYLEIDASSKKDAKIKAHQAFDNLLDMIGYAPFECNLELNETSCEEIEYIDQEEE